MQVAQKQCWLQVHTAVELVSSKRTLAAQEVPRPGVRLRGLFKHMLAVSPVQGFSRLA